MDYDLGTVVYSKAGRDKGRFYTIIKIVDENFVLIADGDKHKLETPKLKKKKHLKPTGEKLASIAEKLENGKQLHNKELVSALRAYNIKDSGGLHV